MHFHEEEALLFELIEDDKITVAKKQHESIRDKIVKLSESKDTGYIFLQDLATDLKDHIRYEERILFPYLEKSLTKENLKKIGDELTANLPNSSAEYYPDEFWVRPKSQEINSASI
jgi:hemerythrin-like domain-containing protein